MHIRHPVIKLAGILILYITASSPAYAYIDPGTGSLIIQSVIGAIAAIGLTLKLYWHKLKVLFSRRTNVNEENETPREKSEE